MDLILWRHAEAEDATPGQDDMSRRLTTRGAKQARKVARWLQEHRPDDLRILVSPSVRTRQTADALGVPYQLEPRIGPAAGVTDLIGASGWPNGSGAVMLVGHQPTLGQAAAFALGLGSGDWNIKKGALYWITRHKGSVTLLAVVHPDMI